MVGKDLRKMCSGDLLKLLCEGDNITLEIVNGQVCISSTGGGAAADPGIKYHIKDGDDIIVKECYEYLVDCGFFIDEGGMFTLENGAKLINKNEIIVNNGVLKNCGLIKNCNKCC